MLLSTGLASRLWLNTTAPQLLQSRLGIPALLQRHLPPLQEDACDGLSAVSSLGLPVQKCSHPEHFFETLRFQRMIFAGLSDLPDNEHAFHLSFCGAGKHC